jgi:hypothetical protein
LWNCSHPGAYLPKFLLSAAHALFQQVIFIALFFLYILSLLFIAHNLSEVVKLIDVYGFA